MRKYLKNLSKTSIMHYIKMAIRASFLIAALILYITGDIEAVTRQGIFPLIVWLWYLFEMISRLLPSDLESMGCEKVFARNYRPPKVEREPKNQSAKTTFIVAAVWFLLNGAIFALYGFGIIDKYILAMVALAYGVCDIICILFFCPFQTWFMKNRCCTTCRIYNWDFAMLFTPFLFIPSVYTWTLLGLALIILIRWEVTYKLHPERFSERTNESLRCKNCTEKLCKHKVQLQHFIKKHSDILYEKLEPIGEGIKDTYEKVKDKTVETYGKVKDKTVETYEKVKDKTVETYEKVKDKTVETYGKVKEKTVEFISVTTDKTAQAISKATDKTVETYEKVKEKTVETYEKVKDKTKEILGIEKPTPETSQKIEEITPEISPEAEAPIALEEAIERETDMANESDFVTDMALSPATQELSQSESLDSTSD